MVSRAIVYVKSVLISASGPQKWSESHIQALSQGGAPQSSCEKALSCCGWAGGCFDLDFFWNKYLEKASYFVNAFRCYSDWHLRNTEDRQIKGFQMHPLWIFNTEILHCPVMKTNHLCKGKTVFPLVSLTEDVGIYSVSDSILNLISLPFVVSSYLTWQALILYIPLIFFFFYKLQSPSFLKSSCCAFCAIREILSVWRQCLEFSVFKLV